MLTTARLRLEPLGLHHADALFAVLAHAEAWTFLGGLDPAFDRAAVVRRLERLAQGPPPERSNQRWLNALVFESQTNTPLGRVEATLHDDVGETWGEVAYVFSPVAWGRGFATEAMRAFIGDLVERYGVVELWACMDPANERSHRLADRLGFGPGEPRLGLASYDPGDLACRLVCPSRLRPG